MLFSSTQLGEIIDYGESDQLRSSSSWLMAQTSTDISKKRLHDLQSLVIPLWFLYGDLFGDGSASSIECFSESRIESERSSSQEEVMSCRT